MTRRLRLFPLNSVLFPGAVLNLHIFEPRYKQMIDECLESGEGFGVALIADGAEMGDTNVMPHDIGSVAEIVEVQPLPFGRYFISTIGRERFRILAIVSRDPYLTVEAEVLDEDSGSGQAADDLATRVRELFAEYTSMLVEFSGQETSVEIPFDAQGASYSVGDALQIAETVKQGLLEAGDTAKRLRTECDFLERLLPQLRRLLERRREELAARGPSADAFRLHQEQFFGTYYSRN